MFTIKIIHYYIYIYIYYNSFFFKKKKNWEIMREKDSRTFKFFTFMCCSKLLLSLINYLLLSLINYFNHFGVE